MIMRQIINYVLPLSWKLHQLVVFQKMPRVVSCLAHNGKVAWDVKWRPTNISDSCKHRMGYLAVVLGNGSLEVWEVPLPHVLRAIYMHREGTDPRFIKLEPVFKCSMLRRRDLQSIPLTVEWSVTSPHDYLLTGCHDGTIQCLCFVLVEIQFQLEQLPGLLLIVIHFVL